MSSNLAHLPPGDPKLVNDIVDTLKKEGLFDQFRKESLADVDTKVECVQAVESQSQSYIVYIHSFIDSFMRESFI